MTTLVVHVAPSISQSQAILTTVGMKTKMGNYFLYLALAQDLLSSPFHSGTMCFPSTEEPPENDDDSSSEEILVPWTQ